MYLSMSEEEHIKLSQEATKCRLYPEIMLMPSTTRGVFSIRTPQPGPRRITPNFTIGFLNNNTIISPENLARYRAGQPLSNKSSFMKYNGESHELHCVPSKPTISHFESKRTPIKTEPYSPESIDSTHQVFQISFRCDPLL